MKIFSLIMILLIVTTGLLIVLPGELYLLTETDEWLIYYYRGRIIQCTAPLSIKDGEIMISYFLGYHIKNHMIMWLLTKLTVVIAVVNWVVKKGVKIVRQRKASKME